MLSERTRAADAKSALRDAGDRVSDRRRAELGLGTEMMRPMQRSAIERSGRRRTVFLSTVKQDFNNNEFDPRAYADRAAQPGRDFPGNHVVRHEGVTRWFLFGGYWQHLSEAGARDY